MADRDRTLIENLKYMVQKYQEDVDVQREGVRLAEERVRAAEDRLVKAQALLEFEAARLGKQFRLLDENPYAGLTLRNAALKVIRRKSPKPVTFKDLETELTPYGYLKDTQYPSRALHAALIGAADVERVEPGTYRSKEGPASVSSR